MRACVCGCVMHMSMYVCACGCVVHMCVCVDRVHARVLQVFVHVCVDVGCVYGYVRMGLCT